MNGGFRQMQNLLKPRAGLRAARALLRDLLYMFSSLGRIARTHLLRALNRSDYKRWGSSENLESWWESRTRDVAALIPKSTRVIEFGAGRRWLESYLDPSCTYIPSDLVDRGPGTVICDLNDRPLPDLKSLRPDVAVFIGVLEYVKDLPSLGEWLSRQVSTCAASYTYAPERSGPVSRILERLRRARYGYMNTYTENDFIELFRRHGFACVRIGVWNDQRLFLFQCAGPAPPL